MNVFHSWLPFDESSRSLLTPSFLSHCQASLPAPTLRLPAERALLVNASELEMSHGTLSRGWSAPRGRPLLRNFRTRFSPLVDIQRCYHDRCSRQIERKEQMRTLWVRCGVIGCRLCLVDSRSSAGCRVWCIFLHITFSWMDVLNFQLMADFTRL